MITAIAGIALLSAVLIAIPGPSIAYIVGQAMAHGRRTALEGVVGNAAGTLTVGVLVAVGLGSALDHVTALTDALRLLGAAVLVALGVSYAMKVSGRASATDVATGTPDRAVPAARPLGTGYLVGVTNPKALVIFGVLVPSFLPPDVTTPQVGLLVLTTVPVAIGLVVDAVWVEGAHRLRRRFDGSGNALRWINVAASGLMMVMAATLVIEVTWK